MEFRATRLSFEQPAAFRATSQNFEQPVPQCRAFRAHDRSGPDWPVWQQFQVPGSVSRFWVVLGSFGVLELWRSAESAELENSKGQSCMRCDMWLLVFLVSDS